MLGVSRSVGDVIAEIKMSLTSFSGAFMLVEGTSDSRFFRPRITRSCEIVICCSKPVLIQAIKKVTENQTAAALGIVDDDFDGPLNVNHNCSDIVHTDTHDLETLLLESPALEKVLHEYSDPTRLRALEERERCNFRSSLINRAEPFGRLRLINAIHALGISFDRNFSPWKYIDQSNWNLNKFQLFDDFASAAGCQPGDLQHLEQSLPDIPSWNLIQGHDAIAIFSIAMRGILGCRHQLSEETLCSALRLSFDQICFERTEMSSCIRRWENRRCVTVLS